MSRGDRLARPRVDLGPAALFVGTNAGVADLIVALSNHNDCAEARQAVFQGNRAGWDASARTLVELDNMFRLHNCSLQDNFDSVVREEQEPGNPITYRLEKLGCVIEFGEFVVNGRVWSITQCPSS